MMHVNHYTIVCSGNKSLPNRSDFLEFGFGLLGSSLPFSHVQDAEDLNHATYLDFKIDKWRISPAWRDVQNDEPMIRIEFLRGIQIEEFLLSTLDASLAKEANVNDTWIITLELDGDELLDLDYASLMSLASGIASYAGVFVVQNKTNSISVEKLEAQEKNAHMILRQLIP